MRSETTRSIWLPQPRPEARLRLLCFPYAGAGANVYRGWDNDLCKDVELAAVQLPGREWRRSEPLLVRMDALVDHLLPEVSAWLEDPRPGLFFGYSLGAALAFVLALHLRQIHKVGPSALFVAACRAPQLLGKTRLHELGDDDFLAAIHSLGGMPDFIAAEPALLQLTLPAVRADFELLETHAWQAQADAQLQCPVHAYVGSEDQMATRAEMARWRTRTSGRFQIRLFSGGHFFINTARGQLLKTLAADLALVQPETLH
jgi:surfactin synthase thioesterase subunit